MKPSALRVLEVLSDMRPHSAAEFLNGDHGFFLTSVSQRVTELRRAGYRIEGGYAGHALATYRLTSRPLATITEPSGQEAMAL